MPEPMVLVPNWSRNRRWIYFTSKRSGELQIWKISPEGGNITQVTKRGGFEPVESPDGKYIYYAKGINTDRIWRVPVEGGEETLIVNVFKDGYLRYWTVVDNGIYFATRETSRPTIQFFDFATNQLTEVAKLEKPLLAGNPGLTISPDGRWLLYSQIDQNNNDIILIENFR
jgi:Tol biopolymer transport system component